MLVRFARLGTSEGTKTNVKSTFSMIKRKFGDAVRAKTDVATRNEALAKILCHNICVTISAWYELDIEPEHWMPKAKSNRADGPRDVLQFPMR